MTDTHKKLCFVIGEIGATKTRERKIAMWLLNQIVEPVINEGFPDFEVRHGAMVLEQEHINKEILDNLTHAELVIANLSGATPGSLYQVGIRHATGAANDPNVLDARPPAVRFGTAHYIAFKPQGAVIAVRAALKAEIERMLAEALLPLPPKGLMHSPKEKQARGARGSD